SSSDFLDALDQGEDTVVEEMTVQDILDEIFSYEDYMRFLELFLKQLTAVKDSTTGYTTEHEHEDSIDNIYSYQNIQYNPAVLNLMNQKLSR
ncbi:MAG: hypothetical protein HFI37_08895, partial [Lachnospiraceae bacterium]|nr:hypothetical protein [Lachnospiraceae bacterium]